MLHAMCLLRSPSAIPTISRELNAVAEIPWIANGYLITCTALFPIWGKISEVGFCL